MNKLDYIGISPANDVSIKEKLNWLNKVFAIVQNKVRTHGFAVTSHKQVLNYPFYSVDSSSFTAGARYARTPLFKNGRIITVNYKQKENISKFVDASQVNEGNIDNYLYQTEQGIKAYLALEAFANKVWDKRGIYHKE